MRAVVDALATPQGEPLCAAALALADGPVGLAHEHGDLTVLFPGPGPEEVLLRRLETAATAREILATPGVPAAQARALLAALLLLGLAEPAGEVFDPSALGRGAAPAPPPRPERPAIPAGPPPVLAPTMMGVRARPAGAPGAPERSRGIAGPAATPSRPGHAEHGRRTALRGPPAGPPHGHDARVSASGRGTGPVAPYRSGSERSGGRSRPRSRWRARPISSRAWGCRAARRRRT